MNRWGPRALCLAVCLFAPAFAFADEPAPPVGPPPTVSLHIKSASREEALSALSTATGLSFTPADHSRWDPNHWSNKTIDLDFDNELFWVALGKFQEAADIGFTSTDGITCQAVTDRGDWGWNGRPQIASGPVLFTVNQIERSSTVRWADPDHPTDTVSIGIEGSLQPHVSLDVDQSSFNVTGLTDSSGKNLLPEKVYANMTQAYNNNGNNNGRLNLHAMIPIPLGEGGKKVILSGSLRCAQITEKADIDLQDAEKEPVTKTVDGYPVTITVARQDGGVRVSFSGKRPDDADAGQYERFLKRLNDAWIAQVKLIDSAGQSHDTGGGGATLYKDRIQMYRQFGELPAGAIELKWTVPAAITESELPIRIEEIPMP